jgi:hypothetical protein
MTRKYLTIPAVVAGALGMGSSIAWAAEPTTAELLEQVKQLQAKVEQLEDRQTDLSDAEVGATIDRVLRDAESRSQLLQMEGFTAGHDGKHFVLKSADGAYSFSPRIQFQFRNVTNYTEDGPDGDNAMENGFEIRRMKFSFVGTAISPDLEYNFRWATDRSGGGLTLENAYIQYKFADQWAFRAGQWKDNWTKEENTSSEKQLAAERSLLNELIGGGLTDYVQGAMVIFASPDSPFRANLAYHDGANTDNTDFTDSGGVASFGVGAPDFGFSGRVEYSLNNNFNGYDDFTALGNKEDVAVFGVGANWTQAGDTDVLFHTADFQWENTGGLGVYLGYVANFVSSGNPGADDGYNWGLIGQVGYLFTPNWELFGRASYVDLDESAAALPDEDEDTYYELTAGVNYYFSGHNAKVTLDLGWLPDGSPFGISGAGILEGDDDQVYFRGQFQLLL